MNYVWIPNSIVYDLERHIDAYWGVKKSLVKKTKTCFSFNQFINSNNLLEVIDPKWTGVKKKLVLGKEYMSSRDVWWEEEMKLLSI